MRDAVSRETGQARVCVTACVMTTGCDRTQLHTGSKARSMKTAVYLIGAGPGDPELITLKGRRCLEAADCVIYDHLVNRELLQYAPGGAEQVYVGKQGRPGPYFANGDQFPAPRREPAKAKWWPASREEIPSSSGAAVKRPKSWLGPASPSRSSPESRQARPHRPTREFP